MSKIVNSSPKAWYRENFMISTAKNLIDPKAVNAAFGSEAIYWVNPIDDEAALQRALDLSLCFGLYELPASSREIASQGGPRQIGLARLITDEVTMAYLTDVYVLPEFQGKGLGLWLVECVRETLDSWPHLRRSLLVSSEGEGFYSKTLGMKAFEQGKNGMLIMTKKHEGSAMKD